MILLSGVLGRITFDVGSRVQEQPICIDIH